MLSKTKMVVAAALVLGVATVAQAGSKDDADSSGGYQVGPTGQSFGSGINQALHRSLFGQSGNAFDFVAPAQHSRPRRKANNH